MNFNVVTTQVVMLAITIAVGFVATKTKYLPKESKDYISKTIVRVTLPCLNYTSVTNRNFNLETLQKAGLVFLLTAMALVTLYVLGSVSSKILKLREPRATVHKCLTVFGNVGFIGYPLASAVFGQEGLFYAVIFGFLSDSCAWTLGVMQIGKSVSGKGHAKFKALINPNTVAFTFAIITIVLGFKLPALLQDTLTSIGGVTTYLSMLFIGMTLAAVDLKKIYKSFGIMLVVAIKMLTLPIIAIIIMTSLNIDPIITSVVALQIATPCGTLVTIISSEHNSDSKYAAEGMFITTLFSLFTLPFIYMMANHLI